MNPELQQTLSIYVPLLSPLATVAIVMVGFLYNNSRLNDFGARLNDTRDLLRAEAQTMRSDLHAEIHATRIELHTEIQATRADLHAEIQATRADLHAEIQATRADLHSEIQAIRAELHSELQAMNTKIDKLSDVILRVLADHEQRLNRLEERK